MFRLSLRFTRRLGFDVLDDIEEEMLEDDDATHWERGLLLSPAAVLARRQLVLGASRAAHAALAARPAADRDAPLGFAAPPEAASAFRAALGADVRLEVLLAAFTPTVLLYPETGIVEESSLQWWRDGVPPHEHGKGLVQIGSTGGRLRLRGEIFFLPPALRGEGRRRAAWIRELDVDPPRPRDEAGPFWSLGETEIWRVDLLGWHEQLVLAAALGTRLPVTAVVCDPASFPRIGYVVEAARERGRVLVHVPLDAVPEALRAVLETTREVRTAGEAGLVTAEPAAPTPQPRG